MKRSLIFLLAAGPLFVFGQRPDQQPTLPTFRFSLPMPGPVLMPGLRRSGDTALFRPWSGMPGDLLRVSPELPGWPVRVSPPLSVQRPFATGFAIREMRPDRMSCLVPLRMPERMPVNLHANADPLPNAVPRH